jgi:hypothetical protein
MLILSQSSSQGGAETWRFQLLGLAGSEASQALISGLIEGKLETLLIRQQNGIINRIIYDICDNFISCRVFRPVFPASNSWMFLKQQIKRTGFHCESVA